MATRSPKVRTLLALEGRAATLLAGYQGTLARVGPRRHRAAQLRHQARALRLTLTPCERAELRRARGRV